MIGMERFYHAFQKYVVSKHSFEKEHFLEVRGGFEGMEGLFGSRYDRARLIGDKFNAPFSYFEQLSQEFNDAAFIHGPAQ
ncbi:hypothetical protein ROG8370_03322 [Roseovarius gaetbuli]|uniref:Uncharacterized protein n=2 Tax=Roseovarius gaetbuli TaxID=1356575 RepID=A0A1X7A4S9_9RHOB|nr:hypothetical protein ROG8370_03322 [Roseovarius gaetbuli]